MGRELPMTYPIIQFSAFFAAAPFELAMSQTAHPRRSGLGRGCDLCRASH